MLSIGIASEFRADRNSSGSELVFSRSMTDSYKLQSYKLYISVAEPAPIIFSTAPAPAPTPAPIKKKAFNQKKIF